MIPYIKVQKINKEFGIFLIGEVKFQAQHIYIEISASGYQELVHYLIMLFINLYKYAQSLKSLKIIFNSSMSDIDE